MIRNFIRGYLLAALAFWGCGPATNHIQKDHIILTGLDGRAFHYPDISPEVQARLDSNLMIAKRNFDAAPREDTYIWLGRRQAYLYQYDQAIKTFSEGLDRFPESYKLLRHRGHRFITIRQFDKAVEDLRRACALMPETPLETEPDGIPNKLNIPLSSTQFNVWYHLALAYYLNGDLESALGAWQACQKVSVNDDLRCATADWHYMTLRRLGRSEEAEKLLQSLSSPMEIIENDSYYRRILMYRGVLPPDSVLHVEGKGPDADLALATQGYGVANWYLYNGDTARARSVFEEVVQGKHFSSFGFIAAEAELMRLNGK